MESQQVITQQSVLEDILLCQSNWPSCLAKLTFKYRCVELTQDVVEFINEDGCRIPKCYRRREIAESDDEDTESWKQNNAEDDEEEKKQQEKDTQRLHTFVGKCKEVLEEFDDNGCFLKLLGRAPRDAVPWMPQLRVTHVEDILLLLKNSQLLLDHFFETVKILNQRPLKLVIRKHYTLKAQNEFRCFIQLGQLRAISQRHTEEVFKVPQRDIFCTLIQDFCSQIYTENDIFKHQSYVLDVYVEQLKQDEHKVWLVDINPWRSYTNALLFNSFDELEKIIQEQDHENNKQGNIQLSLKKPILRVVESQEETLVQDYSAYRVPAELVEEEDGQQKVLEALQSMSRDMFQ